MSKPTPGPWTAEFVEYGAEVTDDLCILGPTPGFRNVATISRCYQGDRVRDMEQANARLIAMAPELLESLQNLVGLAKMGSAPLRDYKAALADADAAIKKATGAA